MDKKRKPYTVIDTLSICLKTSIASVIKPDPRGDDIIIDMDDAGSEPMPSCIDNYCSNSKVNTLVKEEPTLS